MRHSNGWTFFEKASIRWRIDYLMASQNLADSCIRAHVERPASHAERWSDHAPVTAEFGLGGN
jgi:exodeoxyribonuclease-3